MWSKNYRLQNIQLSKNRENPLVRLRSLRELRRDSLRIRRVWLAQPKRFALGVFKPDPRSAKAGGEYRDRTGDLLVANQALSQLS